MGGGRAAVVIRPVSADERAAWEPLWKGYQTFYEVVLSDETTATTWARLHDPAEPMGVLGAYLDGRLVGIAHYIFHRSCWTVGDYCYLQDLFVAEDARGGGYADALIAACAERCRERGVTELAWQTAYTNLRAQAVYDRVGAKRDERWLDYSLEVAPGATTPDS
jgi:GNAT superfamily N-acetyltransferase